MKIRTFASILILILAVLITSDGFSKSKKSIPIEDAMKKFKGVYINTEYSGYDFYQHPQKCIIFSEGKMKMLARNIPLKLIPTPRRFRGHSTSFFIHSYMAATSSLQHEPGFTVLEAGTQSSSIDESFNSIFLDADVSITLWWIVSAPCTFKVGLRKGRDNCDRSEERCSGVYRTLDRDTPRPAPNSGARLY